MAEVEFTPVAQAWRMRGYRKTAGECVVTLTDPSGATVEESVAEFAVKADGRAWINPKDEIDNVLILATVKTKRTGPPRDLSRRFASTAKPVFTLLAAAGDVELWRTEAGGETRFHVVEQRSAASANIQCHDKAWRDFRQLVERPPLPGLHVQGTERERRREWDRKRHALQAPIAAPRYRVMYLREGKERRSPWLYREDHARQGLEMMQAKYGQRNAIIYVD